MGGFRPSPNFIPSNTQIGTLTSSNHQFTGSVDITGSLLINGVSITANGGGGGGAVSSYTNSGDNRVITSVNSNTINGEANFTYDGTTVQVVGTSVQQKWAYDGSNDASLTVAADGDLTVAALVAGATASFAGGDVHIDAVKHIKFQADGGAFHFQRPGNTNRFIIDVSGGPVYQTNIQNSDMIFRIGTGQAEVARFDQSELSFRLASTNPLHFRDTATAINSPAANKLHVNAPELVITGSTIFSGAFGNTDFETRSVNFSILSPSGTSIVDTTALANNVTYTYSIEDGSFVGQEKKIFGKITFVQGQTTNSNALMITGSNIEGTSFGAPFVMAALSGTAGTGGMSMVWSGTKWLCVGANNFSLQ
tara:strand:- start:694 stop:1788 length:1095 start_codon:yes stop_codon:yes gene_type:complete